MSATTRRRQLKNYFFVMRLKKPLIVTVIAAAVSNYFYGSQLAGLGGLCLTVALASAGWVVYQLVRYYSAPADEVVDAWWDEELARMVEQSYDKLGLDKETDMPEPLLIVAPVLWRVHGIDWEDLRYRKGKDKVVRFAVYQVTIFQLAEHLLASYIFHYDLIKRVAVNEKTYEYHYTDIVSVSTDEASTNYLLPDGQKLIRAQEFRLSVASGESIKVVINPYQITGMVKGELPSSGADKAVRAIRVMLRDKKHSR